MAATKVDTAAAKQAKQKKILIVGLVVLAALMAIQLPKLMGGGKSAPAATPAAAAAPGAPATPSTAGAPVAAAAQTAPTTLTATAVPKPGKAQLASFSLFEAKDPFVQQIKADAGVPGSGTAPAGGAAPAKADSAIAKGGKNGGAQTVKVVPTFATISVNGEPEALQAKQEFPADDPMFRLVAVGAKTAKIGIAGGSLKNGKTVTLQMGKKLTLVNTATGARYTLDLLYTGTAPEETAAFSPAKGDAGSTAPEQQTTTPAP
jgi:hypothetical protein